MHSSEVTRADGVSYFTPKQDPPVGTPLPGQDNLPTVFTPLKIRDVTLSHRITVSPMCTYSASDGFISDWHLVHLGQFALNGASLVMQEATAVEARGRISPEDAGIWKDEHVPQMRRVTDVIHAAGQKAAIQLAHAGRKASDPAPWLGRGHGKGRAKRENGGWPDEVVGPSRVPFDEEGLVPNELSVAEIQELVKAWGEGAIRAVKAGFDIIEIHSAHGYLNTEFLSPISNKRTDEYGGSFENRTRLLREIITTVRAIIPRTMPLFVRISATEWLEHTGQPSWTVNDTIRLAKMLPALGVDLLDVSSGGNSPAQKMNVDDPYYQLDIAGRIRKALRSEGIDLLIGAVGQVNEPDRAREVVQAGGPDEPRADMLLVAKQFLKEPGWVLHVAEALGVKVRRPVQYGYAVSAMEKMKQRQAQKAKEGKL